MVEMCTSYVYVNEIQKYWTHCKRTF